MCIRDRGRDVRVAVHEDRDPACRHGPHVPRVDRGPRYLHCLLYTSDAADERSSVDLGGRRIIKKKKHRTLDLCKQEICIKRTVRSHIQYANKRQTKQKRRA